MYNFIKVAMYYPYVKCVLVAALCLFNCGAAQESTAYGSPVELQWPCPLPEDIDPCTCQYDLKLSNLNLDCSHIADTDQLYDVLHAAFPVSTFQNFTIDSNYYITEIKNNTFAAVTFEEIWISFSALETVQINAFVGMESTLRRLYLYHSNIRSFPFFVIDQFLVLEELSLISNVITHVPHFDSKSLKYLELGLNPLHNIPLDPFTHLPSLRTVRLEATGIRQLRPGLFAYNPELEYISLWGNQLRHLESHWFSFSGVDNPKTIVLNHNYISIIHQETFTGLVGADIFLEYNKIISIEETVWRHIIQHNNTIHLLGNHLHCDCDVAWLVWERPLLDYLENAVCSNGTDLADLNPDLFSGCNITTVTPVRSSQLYS